MTRQQTGSLYFGWYIVGAATTITLLTVGMRMGIGPFFKPIAEDLGLSRTVLSTIVALGMLAYGIGMPIAGFLAQKYGSRAVLLLGTAIVVVSSIWSVNATDPFSFFMAFGILLSLGFSFTSPVALTPVISRWFTRQRGKALFYLSTGSMAGIAVMTPLLTFTIERYGWQHTLIGFTVLFVLLVIPAALMIIRDEAPEHTDLLPGDSGGGKSAPPLAPLAQLTSLAAMRTLPFCKIALGLFACGFSMNLLGSHGVPMLTDHGFDPITAALGIGLIGLVAIPSTLVLGHLADQVPRRNLLAAIYLIRGLGFIGLMMVPSVWYLYAVAAVGGIVWAGSIALSSAILADVYGIRSVGVLYGWAYLGHQIGAMISSWLGGWGYETFGTHWVAFGSAAAILVVAGLVSLRLPDARFFRQPEPSRA
ncbi:major facilitator protein [Alcanivorax xiamenensis]|uniref:Major facilitator protein n=1 Tax=Alcanivorax xiamenensis TaxID=1177156 RepID=A0ABQ6Y6W3_9GAMM|nr:MULTISPECIES: MFS transporter [Alcanivorax]KAF0805144.1 major facilitator protein [Alcanivorax xiamenensis]